MSKTILKKVADENTYIDFDLVELDLENIIICGNSRFIEYGNKTLLDIVKGNYYDDETGYDYETFEQLKKITGKEWKITTIKDYSQSDWQKVYYTNKVSQNKLDEIENFYMGKVSEFEAYEEDDEESVCCVYVPDEIVKKGKKAICEHLGLKMIEEWEEKAVEYALKLEENYKEALEQEKIDYCLICDFMLRKNNEENIFDIKKRFTQSEVGIVVYEKKLNYKKIEKQAQSFHFNNLYEELDLYNYISILDKRFKVLVDEATKEVCKWFNLPYEEYINGNIEWGEDTDYSEFMLELVNNIADWLGIDNYGG